MPENVCSRCRKPAGDKTMCPSCVQKVTARNRQRREERRAAGCCTTCGQPWAGTQVECDSCQQKDAVRRQKPRLACITHYGGVCACCGEAHVEFLQLDHINGGGTQHHKSLSTSIYQTLRATGFPPGYRVLCANCNQAIGFYGYCPHHPEVRRSVRRGK